jgi:hypothetical protein
VIRDRAQRLPDQAVIPREITGGVPQVGERRPRMDRVRVPAGAIPALGASADAGAFVVADAEELIGRDSGARARQLALRREEPDRPIEPGLFRVAISQTPLVVAA